MLPDVFRDRDDVHVISAVSGDGVDALLEDADRLVRDEQESSSAESRSE